MRPNKKTGPSQSASAVSWASDLADILTLAALFAQIWMWLWIAGVTR